MIVEQRQIWTRQPTGSYDINFNLDITDGLQYSYEPWASNGNSLQRRTTHSIAGPASKNIGPKGAYYGIDSATSYINTGGTHNLGSMANGTIVLVVYPFSSAYMLGQSSSGSTGWAFSLDGSAKPTLLVRGDAFYTCSVATTAQEWQVLGITWKGGSSSASSFWKNGSQLGSSFTCGTPNTDSGNIFLFAYDATTFTPSRLAGALIFNKYKTTKEMAELTKNPWQVYNYPKSRAFYSLYTATTDVSVSLTGNSATVSRGTLSVVHENALTGISNTFSRGSLTPALAKTLTGQSSTFSGGLFTTTHTNPLTGNSATFNGGTITPFISGGVTLSGLSSMFSRGTLGLTHSNPLTGQGATFSGGLFSFGTAPITARLVLTQREAGMVFKKRKTRMVLG